MDGWLAKVETRELMEALARLKQVPLAKVMRNAARDFVAGAYQATPLAKERGEGGYLELLDRKRTESGAKVVRYIPAPKPGRKRSLWTRWHTYARGWSRASWIGIMRDLGMGSGKQVETKELAPAVRAISRAWQIGTEQEPGWGFLDDIEFTALAGMDQHIIQAGFDRAADIMERTISNALYQEWQK